MRVKPAVYALVGAAAAAAALITAQSAPAGAAPRSAPLTATVHEFQTKGEARTHVATYQESVYSDGKFARLKRVHLGSRQDEFSSLWVSFPSGPDVRAVPELGIKSTFHATPEMRAAERAGRPDPSAGCLAPDTRRAQLKLGAGKQRGVDVVSIQTGQTGQMRVEAHYAPALGCYLMYEKTEIFSRSGSLEQILEKEVVAMRQGQPAEPLHLDAFEEVAPSEFRLRIAKALGMAECPDCMIPAAKREDELYHRLRGLAGAVGPR